MTCHQFVEHNSQAKDIRAMIQVLAERLLGTHVVGSADQHAALGLGCRRAGGAKSALRKPFGQTEVQHLGASTRIEHDIGRFDVTMHNAPGMRGLERLRHLDAETDNFADPQAPLLHEHVQRLALHVFHGQKGAAILGFSHLVDDTDVGMSQPGSRPGFRAEALDLIGVAGELDRHDLEGNGTFQPGVFSQKHLAHAAGSQPAHDSIMPDGLRRHAARIGLQRQDSRILGQSLKWLDGAGRIGFASADERYLERTFKVWGSGLLFLLHCRLGSRLCGL